MAIYEVSPTISGHVGGRNPVSLEKLQKGNARWSHLKVILGFLTNGDARTITVPPDKLKDVLGALDKALSRLRVSFSSYYHLLGRLCHLSVILPVGLGLFSPFNKGLWEEPKIVGVGKRLEI